MYKFLTLSFFFIFAACAKSDRGAKIVDFVHTELIEKAGKKIKVPARYWDKDLKVYIDQYLADARRYNVPVSSDAIEKVRQVRWVDDLTNPSSAHTAGICLSYSAKLKGLGRVTKKSWKNIEVKRSVKELFGAELDTRMRQLMYHELTHCFLNKGHLPLTVGGETTEEAIMSPVLNRGSERPFEEWNAMVRELFSRKFLDAMPNGPSKH